MFNLPDRFVVYQNDASLGIDLFDTWQYNPDAYFGTGQDIPFVIGGNANNPDDCELAQMKANMLNEFTPGGPLMFVAVKITSFIKYWWERLVIPGWEWVA